MLDPRQTAILKVIQEHWDEEFAERDPHGWFTHYDVKTYIKRKYNVNDPKTYCQAKYH